MRGLVLFSLMIAGIIVFAGIALGVTYTKYDEVTTTVDLDDGITCTINGKEVSNGETVTVASDMCSIKIHIEAEFDLPICMAGKWTDGQSTVTGSCTDTMDYTVDFNHGSYTGNLIVHYTADDGDLGNVILKFTIGSGITVKCGGNEIKDGDEYTFVGDSTVTVTTNDGLKHDVKYSGTWKNDYDMSGGASGYEYNTTVNIHIIDMMYFGDGHGTMDVHI